ncbi:tetratricopeptide repeat-containing sensor histidine kinase [Flagellimonas myxillae]|uniref:tetratricopeptide repeat-containing sensor histidine kinase n=1 Tax=Flagellimonas myxillae TaxID=2942214 RepID=UPI00201F4444|nr:sensor histidine kinase [Muricauda myxillae]MCL6265702.1 sensor histidine kinase [Muricauda myxillae]
MLFLSCNKQSRGPSDTTKAQTDDIRTLIDASRDSAHLDIVQRTQFLVRAKMELSEVANDTLRLDHLSRISLGYKRLGDSLGFRKMNAEVLQLASKGKLYKAEGESYWDMAAFQKSYGVMDSAYFYYQKAYNSFLQLPTDSTSQSLRGRILFNMGSIEDFFNDYLGAEKSVTEALRIYDDLEDEYRAYLCNNLLGVISNNMDDTEMALNYYQKAGEGIKKLDVADKKDLIRQNKNNIAHTLLNRNEYEKAERAYRKLLGNNLKENDEELYPTALVSLAYAIFKGKKDYGEASAHLLNALEAFEQLEFSEDQARAKQFYAEVLVAKGDTLNAKIQAEEGLELAKASSNNFHHLEILRLLTHIDSENAVAYSDTYYQLNEQIKEEERTTRDKFARIRLETDQVIQRNEALSRDKLIWALIAIAVFLASVAIFVILAQRASNNKLKFQQKQQEANQEIYNLMLSQQGKFEEGKKLEKKRISEELHDSVLGDLLSIRMFMGVLNNDNNEEAVSKRADMIEKLREVEEEIRTISHELSNASYEKFYNFIVSLEELIGTISSSSGIKCSFTFDDHVEWDALDGDIKINTYRIVQESLKNSVKHAQCKQATISFTLEDGLLTLTIQDDGVGFEVNKGRNGIGLRNLTSRAEKINGSLQVESQKGEGTTITVQIPAKYVRPKQFSNIGEQKQTLNA